ncbi:YD repeat (two copies) [Weeksella virosa]|nr:YD repeat (two copies) [Weeksella virosa]
MHNLLSFELLEKRGTYTVRTKTSNDGTVLSEQRTVYNNFGELILPQFVYAKKGEMGQTEAVADRKITYNSYDAQGNLTQYTMENGIPVSIIWGYNGQYPIAKIEGKAYSSISSHAEVLIAASNSISGLNVNSFNALRSSFPDALITGYIYQPLVGVTMIVQPNGQVEKYAYDAAGRLKEIRNHDNEILKTFEYNYAQP